MTRRVLIWIALLIVGGLGIWARFTGLGTRPLAIDEYFYVIGVESICETGFPEYPGGGYYLNGPLVQYVTALVSSVVENDVLACRLTAVIFNIAAAALLYRYVRLWLGCMLSAVVAVIFLASSWEVEFARFARHYAAFQFFALFFFYALGRICQSDDRAPNWSRYWVIPIAGFLVSLSHHLGVFFLPLMAVPLILPDLRKNFPGRAEIGLYCLSLVMVCIVCLSTILIDWGRIGLTAPYPAGFVPRAIPMLRLPAVPLWNGNISADAALAIALGVPAAFCCLAFPWIAADSSKTGPRALLVVMISSALVHNLMISALCGAALLLRYEIPTIRKERTFWIILVASSIAIAAAWILYAVGTMSTAGEIRQALFIWPNLYDPIYSPWRDQLPILGATIGAACLYQIATHARDPLRLLVSTPAILLTYFCILIGIVDSVYVETRYTFFLYPLGLITVVMTARDFASMLSSRFSLIQSTELIAAAASLLLFSLTEDFNIRHLLAVSSRTATYRLGEFEAFDRTWYSRYDFRSPAEFLNSEANIESDKVILVGFEPVSYYLSIPHAHFLDRDGWGFQNVSRQGGAVHSWSKQKLLSTAEELRMHTKNARSVWIIWRSDPARRPFHVADIWKDRLEGVKTAYVSEDERVSVDLISLRSSSEQRWVSLQARPRALQP